MIVIHVKITFFIKIVEIRSLTNSFRVFAR